MNRTMRQMSSRSWLLAMIAVGLVGLVLAGLFATWRYAPLIGWDAAAVFFSGGVWLAVIPMDAEATESHARREDPAKTATSVLVVGASIASLVAVGVVLIAASSATGAKEGLLTGLAAASVVISWLLIHTLFTLRYANVYYEYGEGVDFNQKQKPRYSDFAYLSFTLGMTFQVSDTDLTIHQVRATALRHALLSYFFGAVILATTVNFVVGLSTSSH